VAVAVALLHQEQMERQVHQAAREAQVRHPPLRGRQLLIQRVVMAVQTLHHLLEAATLATVVVAVNKTQLLGLQVQEALVW
jgi:hypothetical protein